MEDTTFRAVNFENLTLHSTTPKYHEYNPGDVTWLLACTAITWLMVPGVGFFYNGLAPNKSSLILTVLCFYSVAVVSIQWYLVGYSLCLSNTGGPFIGNLDHIFLRNIGDSPAVSNPKVPALLVSIWYCLFACITPTIILGALSERARLLPAVVFIFFWSTFVFDFLTYWTWNINGWLYVEGGLDFGGGTPVHISTGAAALAYALVLGKRQDPTDKPPHNMTHVILGCSFIWFGWLVANAGSGLSPNYRAVVVFVTTNLSASVGGLTWALLDYVKIKPRKFSALGFCCGAVCGLVAVTPASGFISPASSMVFGIVGSMTCNLSLSCKKYLRIDDAFDVFCVHGVGGIVGNLLTAVFAEKEVAGVDGTEIKGGWLDGHWEQMYLQIIDTCAGFAWAFVVTLILAFTIDKIPGLALRVTVKNEEIGLDKSELGESMYQHIEDLKVSETLNSCTCASNAAAHVQKDPSSANAGFIEDSSIEMTLKGSIVPTPKLRNGHGEVAV